MLYFVRMKNTFQKLSVTASVLVALSSCSSTDDNFYGDLEAMSASEVPLGEDTIPPWVEESDGRYQVDAGDRTPTYQQYPIPEPGETIEDTGGSFSSGQSQERDIVLPPPDYKPFQVTGTSTETGTTVTPPKPKTETKPKKKVKITKPSILVYKVRSGDNLSVIAQRCGTSVAAIRRLSGIKGDLIYAGQTIKVPYTPKAQRHINATGRSGSSSSSSSSSSSRSYTVRSGDTISGIAARYGVGYKTVLKLNNMTEAQARRLRPGQKIKIPK